MTLMALVSADTPWFAAAEQPLGEATGPCSARPRLPAPQVPSDPMDVAIHRPAQGQHLLPLPPQVTPIQTYGLRPGLFATTHVLQFSGEEQAQAFSKGALEAIAQLCRLGPEEFDRVRNQANELACEGMRVWPSPAHR